MAFQVSSRRRSRTRGARRWRRGFTLIEAALTIVIVGTAIVATAELLSVGTVANGDAHRLTTGMNLASNIREFAHEQTGAELLARNGQSYTPPLDGRGVAIEELEGWAQHVTVEKVDPNNVSMVVPSSTESPVLRLSVRVTYNERFITQFEWLLAVTE